MSDARISPTKNHGQLPELPALPLVSMGMPLYNEERHLREALDSLLAQDYANFELIISDNASEDMTQQICREYAARDSRIHYHCNEVNLGMVENFNRVFHGSKGKYFMWVAGHDLHAPSFLRKCVEALENEPAAVLCSSRVKVIDHQGHPTTRNEVFVDTRGRGVLTRFNIAVWRLSSSFAIYGLFRRSAMADSRMARFVWASDSVLLAELALMGPFIILPEALYYPVQEWDDVTGEHRKERMERMFREFSPANSKRSVRFPELHHSVELARGVLHSRVPLWMKPPLVASALLTYSAVVYRNLPAFVRTPARKLFRKILGMTIPKS